MTTEPKIPANIPEPKGEFTLTLYEVRTLIHGEMKRRLSAEFGTVGVSVSLLPIGSDSKDMTDAARVKFHIESNNGMR